MAAKKKSPAKKAPAKKASAKRALAAKAAALVSLDTVLAALRAKATKKTLDGMSRYGIPSDRAWGVTMDDVKAVAKRVGRDHALAAELWATDLYEARLLAALVDDPAKVSAAQMERWAADFSDWAVCDTACLHLFDRTPHAWGRVDAWAAREGEFVRRAAFALLAALAVHDRASDDATFLARLALVERASTDGRNFVKKGTSWALRAIGHRNAKLHAASLELARRLASSTDPTARWIGKDAIRDLQRPLVLAKIAKKRVSA